MRISARKAGFASTLYNTILAAIKPLVPTWTKPQVGNLARLVAAIHARHSLVITELAREYPSDEGEGPHDLRYRVKRIWRFINSSLLDTSRLVDSLYRLSLSVCTVAGDLLPVLFDTTFFEPFALLTASIPAGGRGLPIGWVTYHRHQLEAVFSQAGDKEQVGEPVLSESLIERRLVDEIWVKLASGIRAVLVADRGFASGDFFAWMMQQGRHFVVRFQGKTHVAIPDGKGGMTSGAAKEVISVQAGEKRWIRGAEYRKDGVVKVNLLVILDEGQKEPWYLVTDGDDDQEAEQLYRWRMRQEREYKDGKDQLLLGVKGTRMTVRKAASAARLLDALMILHWFVALMGLQAIQDLPEWHPQPRAEVDPQVAAEPDLRDHYPDGPGKVDAEGPATAPEPRKLGEVDTVPHWLRRFQAWGAISYVKLGLEFLRWPTIGQSLARLVAWITDKLIGRQPLWTRRQARYRARLPRFG